jgi:hypothetical protein
LTEIGPGAARWYLRLLVLRHAAIIGLLVGMWLLASKAPEALRSVGGVLLIGGFLGFVLSMLSVVPLAWQRTSGNRSSMTPVLSENNELTGHALVPEAVAASDRWHSLTPRTFQLLVGVEVGLFVLFPIAFV